MVSYYHWLQVQTFDHPAVQQARTLPFETFIQHPQTAASFEKNPATRYMKDATGTLRANHFIRLEHLHTDLAPLTDHLGFTPQIPHANPSKRAHDYRPFYTEQTAACVARICAADIARFGYSFDKDH